MSKTISSIQEQMSIINKEGTQLNKSVIISLLNQLNNNFTFNDTSTNKYFHLLITSSLKLSYFGEIGHGTHEPTPPLACYPNPLQDSVGTHYLRYVTPF